MPIIDVHAEIGTTPLWGVPFTDANLIRSMQKYGVVRSVVSSSVGNSCDFVRGNNQISKIVQTNTAVAGCIIVNINYPEQAQNDMHSYLSSDNFAGMLLTAGTRDRYVSLTEGEELLNAHRRFIKPVFLHAISKEALIAANDMAKAFPIMKFILLGMGGEEWRLATMLADRTLNLILEVSGIFSPDKIKFAVEHIGSHRMVYGSGLPYVDPSSVIGLVEDADISDGDKRNIFEGTARKVFGWRGSAQ